MLASLSRRAARGTFALLLVAGLVLGTGLDARAESKDDAPAREPIRIQQWLLLGPVSAPLPAFNDESDDKTGAKELLAFDHIALQDMVPQNNVTVNTLDGPVRWHRVSSDTNVVIPQSTEHPSIAYLAAFVEMPRWMKVKVTAQSSKAFEIKIDGESVVKRDSDGNFADTKDGTAKLGEGKHLLIAKCVNVPGDSLVEWQFDVSVGAGKGFDVDPAVSLDATRALNIQDVLDAATVRSPSISPDGELYSISIASREPPEGDREGHTEIRRFKDHSLVRVIRDSKGSGWEWAPMGHKLSYVTRDDKKATVHLLDIDTGETSKIVEGVKDFGGYEWSPDGKFIAYTVDVEAKDDDTGVMRIRGLSDRRAGERDRSYVYVASVPEGMTRRVTSGKHANWVYDIHPNGKQMLIGRVYEISDVRPYRKQEVLLLDLDTQETTMLVEDAWLDGARFSPDGKKILFTGGPSSFDLIGANVPDDMIPNDYDGQAFIFDLESKDVDPITKDFDPSVLSVAWPDGRYIYMSVEEGEYRRLYRYDTNKKSYKNIELGFDFLLSRAVARKAPRAVVTGMSARYPSRAYTVELDKGRVKMVLNPSAERFENITIGEVKDFDFKASNGSTIVGRVHFPPNFDASKKWPAIVYYYGGTSPVGRRFGGRYPKNLWAAHGYVVYVLQPSGATGFGQAFSARHVNDWGKTTVKEIVEGTQAFLKAHPYVDPKRVGCIGASYGGFMTELLVTRTDIFAAAVSHAGISALSSYWGEGYWGYGYSAVATANSFPWNRRDIYVDQSPLFAADKVNTPLLLLHGDADTNVPRGESEQMYAALKLLGKPVEYIRVEGQNHWVVDYKKRIVWNDAIIGWFDKWLKDQPEWFVDAYPPRDDEENEDAAGD